MMGVRPNTQFRFINNNLNDNINNTFDDIVFIDDNDDDPFQRFSFLHIIEILLFVFYIVFLLNKLW